MPCASAICLLMISDNPSGSTKQPIGSRDALPVREAFGNEQKTTSTADNVGSMLASRIAMSAPPLTAGSIYSSATGRTGDPVAPRNLVASSMKQKLATPSRASSSSARFSIR